MSYGTDFYQWQGPRSDVTVGDAPMGLPVFYHHNDVFMSLHAASVDAVAAQLPSAMIRPIRWIDGRAVVGVIVFRYQAITWTRGDGSTGALAPYGEVAIVAFVTAGPAARALPLLGRRLAGFVMDIPVTTIEARDAGIALFGFPKFVADMDFFEHARERRLELSEGGSRILTLTVRPGGLTRLDRRSLVAYTTLNGQLLETVIPTHGHVRTRLGGRAGELRLGDHEVGERLRKLQVSTTPVAVFSYLDHRSILPAGRPVGPARGYSGYAGVDRAFGRFTVSYPGTPALDQYAAASTTAHVPTVAS